MTSQDKIKFFKYQGSGNDFVLIEDYNENFYKNLISQVPKICDRNFGIGADGVLLLQSSRIATAKMRIINSDGSEATMCGNGLRCVIKHLDKKTVSIETNAGICLGKFLDGEVVATLPVVEEVISPLALGDNRVGHLMNAGVPHLIIETDDLDIANFEKVARSLRYHRLFSPEGTNVSFVKMEGNNIFIRTYERGVEGETLACGTACAASVLVVRKSDKQKKKHYVIYPKSGNPLQFTFDSQDNMWMQGPTEKIFQGEIMVKLDEARIKAAMY